ncbi:hypothetical protein POM88_004918 [Heracleum sosnowskyi]|uniref:TF-B3 domain-containing protein n=1 Tax=Heracleum sosnowskyi TaxID=360622 RepID=A0AAD8JL90_9APIA|nr:hypothetical protein POM88_004918 [Heracleum sosnowskyi]
MNEMVDIKVFNNHSFIEERSGALLFFNVAYSGSGVFSFVVQSSHLNEEVGKVVVCEDLYHLLKKFRNVEKITLWLLKTKWEVGIEWYDYHCVLGNGWSLFARDLELCLGDTCIFESTNNALEFNVCVFKREEYDFVMFEPDLHGVKFFQLVMSDSLEGCRIVLPILFGYYLVKSISSVVEFVMPSNQTWSICYEDDPPRFSLLKDFASFYGLRENFVVIFEYIGYSRFFVRIFDQNSVEIVYLKLMKSLGIATDLVKSKNPKGEEGTIKEYFELHDDIYESPNLLLLSKESHVVCEFTVAFFSSEIGEKMQDVYVCNSLETFSGDWINDSVSRFIAHGRQWRVEVKLESNICRFGHGWNEFVRDNDLVAGDICILKLVNFVGRLIQKGKHKRHKQYVSRRGLWCVYGDAVCVSVPWPLTDN